MDNTNFTLFETLSDANGFKINIIPWVGYIQETEQVLYCNNLYKQIKIEDDYAIITDANNILKYTANTKLSSDLGEIQHIYDPETKQGMYIFEQDLTDIPEYAFRNNLDLFSIIIPDGVTQIKTSAFQGCTNLINVLVGSGITSIKFQAFKDCTNLTGIIILEKPAFIEYGAFMNCSNLTGIIIKDTDNIDNVQYTIGQYAFQDCNNLTTAIIGKGITMINSAAFSGCTSLSNLVLSDGLTTIGGSCFNGCSGLTEVILPNSVVNVYTQAFWNCTGLISAIYNDSLFAVMPFSQSGSYAFQEGIQLLCSYSCYNCKNITNITIPNSVTKIESNVFDKCSSLTSITIGSGVTNIGGYVFRDCTSLTNITYDGTISQWNLIPKGTNWHKNVPATVVHCSDGDITL